MIDDADEGTGRPADPPAFEVTRSTPVGDVRVHVWPARDAVARRPVLLSCHGWTDAGAVLGPLATALGRRWTVVAADAPGHGRSPWTPAPRYRVADQAVAALAVLDQLPRVAGHRAAVVVHGHSMGALTASRLAVARPGVVRHLVLEDPARAVLRRSPSAAGVRERIVELRALGEAGLLDRIRADEPSWPADEYGPWAQAKAELSLPALSVPVDWGEPLPALLADVTCPVTLVHGRIDRGGVVSPVSARRCAAACRGGCDVVPFDTGHQPRREAREPFIAVLAAVLGRYES